MSRTAASCVRAPPAPQPVRMSQSDIDLSDSASSILPQSTAYTDADADDELGDDRPRRDR